jgi:phosphoribosylanthranilate isomerase
LLKQVKYVRHRKKCQPKLSIPIVYGTMSQIEIQIYEIQTPDEAIQLIDLGVDRIGSVILSIEKWKIPVLKETINVTKGAGSKSTLIPLFQNPDLIFKTLDYYKPDIIHFCEDISGNNNFEKLLSIQKSTKEKFPEVKIMRSIPIAQSGRTEMVNTIKLARIFEPVSDFFLTDTLLTAKSNLSSDQQPVNGFIGITGKTCDWDMARKLVKSSSIPVILAGGISPDNVFDGISYVKPAGVDSCTGTNAKDENGSLIRFKKDFKKIKRFVKEVRRAEKEQYTT